MSGCMGRRRGCPRMWGPMSQADAADRIAVQPWMRAAQTKAVMVALEAAGGAGCARSVGGCVRNAILRQPVDDVDIATTLTPDETIAALKAARLKAVPTGIEHGTITRFGGG